MQLMFNIFQVTRRRKEQLDKEKIIDYHIKKNTHECPELILSFILECRKNNREQFDNMLDDNLVTKSDKITKNISEINIIYDNILHKINHGHNMCKILEDIRNQKQQR